MGDAGMDVSLVAGVWRQLLPQEGGQVLVGYDVLQAGNVQPSGTLMMEHRWVNKLGKSSTNQCYTQVSEYCGFLWVG